MRACDRVKCACFPCSDVNKEAYQVPQVEVDPEAIRIVMIAEAPPTDAKDYFYAPGSPFYLQTTVQAFSDAGVAVSTMQEILDLGIYITTAVKCGKTAYSRSGSTVKACAEILEKEIALFPEIKVFLLMGDVAIKSMNLIWKGQTGAAVIPAGSTYKIRKRKFFLGEKRVFPSYLLTGKNYLIEKSKRRMIAEDIREAVGLIR